MAIFLASADPQVRFGAAYVASRNQILDGLFSSDSLVCMPTSLTIYHREPTGLG